MSAERPRRLAETLRKFGLGDDDLTAWEQSKLPPDGFEDWLTDRVARRPAGRRAREVHGAVLRECRRVLAPGGRLAVYTTSPALRGTPAAPEPLASRGHFYEDEELADSARHAGLAAVSVINDNGGQLLTASR